MVTRMTDKTTNSGTKSASGENAGQIGLIGGAGLTVVNVYNQSKAPDGVHSGCAHVHAVSDEAYMVMDGSGYAEFHDLENGYRKMTLNKGDYVQFPPTVMHRLVSNGDLVVLCIMSSAGLPESGDARIYFGPDADADPELFNHLVNLPFNKGLQGALERRDHSVRAYMDLIHLHETDRKAYFEELRRYVDTHCQAVAGHADTFNLKVSQGPLAWAQTLRNRLAQLPGRPDIQLDVKVNRSETGSNLGMCGILRPMLTLTDLESS